MLNCTKRNVNIITLLLSLLIFTIIIGITQNVKKEQKKENMQVQTQEIQTEEVELQEITNNKVNQSAIIKGEWVVQKLSKSNSKEESEESIYVEKTYTYNIWRIKIPKINLDAPISEGTSQEVILKTVGHFSNSSKWEGNVALAAHNRGSKCDFFKNIKNLEKGDKIIYTSEKGKKEYEVVLNTIIEETDWSYLEETNDNRITLITCETDKKEYRRCVQAVEVFNKGL